MSQWIWKFGEYEIYHSMLVHSRRQEYGYMEPAVWRVYPCEPLVEFHKQVTTNGGRMHVRANGDFSVVIGKDFLTRRQLYGQSEIEMQPGTTDIMVRVFNRQSFPALYISGVVETDGSWDADDLTLNASPVGTWDALTDPDVLPDVFPFAYRKIAPVSREEVNGGVLFDFGKETFARTTFKNLSDEKVTIQFGESREEALDPVWSVIHFTESPADGVITHIPYAFRYLFVSEKDAEVEADYEVLPLERKGRFSSDDAVVNAVWDTAAYTFELNSREFFLDGIKRDRWVWSADAYQSLFVNHYLYFDKEIEKRTLIALGGKQPFRRHINTIMDYSFFWVISLYEYYKTYGDLEFLHSIAPQMDAVMTFCLERTDADGFMRGREGDWIFIDWAPMDKTGALCGEQILYAKALECYAKIKGLLGQEDGGTAEMGRKLQQAVLDKFYDPEARVFVDSYESGRHNITRHSNILAYLFLPLTEAQKSDIYERVVLNDEVAQITTPYFKFYENQVHCMAGDEKRLETSIREYYGSMLALGATTLYEEYDPNMHGAEHYAMYGNPYQKSLCHAWSASPIYLLGAYRLGVTNTGIAYDTFDVRPKLGGLTAFEGAVPVPGGEVKVSLDSKVLRVTADVPGGTLYFAGKTVVLEAGKTVELTVNE